MDLSATPLTRKARWLLFAAFAVALLVAILHEWDLPQYCLRLLKN